MSDLGEALAAANESGDLGEALRLARGSDVDVPAQPGAIIEWIAVMVPRLAEGMRSTPRKQTFIVLGDPLVEIDDSPQRFVLLGWNHGPNPVALYSASAGTQVGVDVPPQSEFVLPGVALGGIRVEALANTD